MATTDALSQQRAASRPLQPTLKSHLAYTLLCGLVIMLMLSLVRLALLAYNNDMIGDTPMSTVAEGFFNGLRFDLRVVVYLSIPLLLAILSARAMAARGLFRAWLTIASSIVMFLGLMEMDFYREFHQRLNGLVFQYVKEDPKTVLSMLWYGFPVVRYLLAWAFGTWLLSLLFKGIDRLTRPDGVYESQVAGKRSVAPWYVRGVVFFMVLLVAVIAARGTLRQGPPMRWGDAFTTDSNFVNQLGLNGTLTLIDAAKSRFGEDRANIWKSTIEQGLATQAVRDMLLTANDKLVDADSAAVRRDFTPPADNTLPIKNVVVILMESFAGHSVGALGSPNNITPYFDKLAKEGVLFDRFFSNGTHTHQGMFATMACYPNLPGFEYLMQTPEGGHKLSGLPALLSARDYDDVYVYNGDFAWDNQSGFFGNQGMTTFIGRNDFVNPVFSDPTWGVSDQDMFDRGNEELAKHDGKKPIYALLQTLSNHTPYALPKDLPVEKVTGQGRLDEHLTAMRYSDWALGQFFEKARKEPYFKQTLFVIVGDHGFGNHQQVTEMDLGRFNVPLLLIAPGIQDKFGALNHTVGTQIDIVPTIMGRLGGETRHQCWGRDLLNLPAGDPGIGMIKPSGSEQIVGLIKGDRILIESKDMSPRMYRYELGANFKAELIEAPDQKDLTHKLESFIQTATKSLLDNTAGVVHGTPE
ncbi:LTA synthase family protein [Pseudomonas donghuensis]|uniref:LTA synthase family protein n=1 Tax=Pseudomonas donghuensis TaxID=1163398 RepID=A0AAP0SCZ0_9PSED|nr:LTA synthase family protein [Pseudomonas donghuensis]MDF9894712.1 phosphoglycerol transferase MdoB-like AlkP superfamily enzyme [Pseudomonas vranovensis]KDN97830.1 LTA synthase family protein [Pseudomonas donghuensis]MCP6693105.1 LTA synthase family protein [Pseudomonas donghuensis]UVL23007.1 LTA synthase family protein [Pseudomonas donghuensis]UVL28146.1 LTA synthase family protein [Pseudomonas donghuensis]